MQTSLHIFSLESQPLVIAPLPDVPAPPDLPDAALPDAPARPFDPLPDAPASESLSASESSPDSESSPEFPGSRWPPLVPEPDALLLPLPALPPDPPARVSDAVLAPR
jgi:hypothetical protein